jgi:DNA mismatch endonuclease (patch repair protein)
MEKHLRILLPGGMFRNVSTTRSATMSHIRSKNNSTTERPLRMALVRAGQSGWTLHPAFPGRPDFYFPVQKVALFVDGCFWHGCGKCCHVPRTRSKFWKAKLERNQQRDRRIVRELRQQGIRVIRIWEHQLKKPKSVRIVINKLQSLLA